MTVLALVDGHWKPVNLIDLDEKTGIATISFYRWWNPITPVILEISLENIGLPW